MITPTFYFIRHAQSEANLDLVRICGRNPSTPLTEIGKWQAQKLGEYLKNENVHFSQVYTSTAVRTQETANICLKAINLGLRPIECDNFSEQCAGIWAGQIREDIYKKREDVREALARNNWTYIPGDGTGESQHQVAQRMKEQVQAIIDQLDPREQNPTIAIFTHGNAIKFFQAEVLDEDRHTAYLKEVDNTSITIFKYENNEYKRLEKNLTPHLKAQQSTIDLLTKDEYVQQELKSFSEYKIEMEEGFPEFSEDVLKKLYNDYCNEMYGLYVRKYTTNNDPGKIL